MNIYNKLEEIRNKPEHIRRRYVWMMVAISMFFVLVIWVLSFKTGQKKDSLLPSDVMDSEIVDQFKEQKDSLKSTVEGVKGVMQQENINNNQ